MFVGYFLLLLRLKPVGLIVRKLAKPNEMLSPKISVHPPRPTFGFKSSQVAIPRNAFCMEQRASSKAKEMHVHVCGLFSAAPPAQAGWADCT